jgi:hypothetical protein
MAAAITSASLGVAAAGYSIYQGAEQKKKAKQAINDYERQTLSNAAERIQISTMGSDLAREESQRTVANIVDALQGGGGRMLGAGIPQLQAGINQTNRQIQKDLDDQVRNREYAIAQEEGRLTSIREQRDIDNLSGLSSQYQTGNSTMMRGIGATVQSLGNLAGAIEEHMNKRETPESLSNSITPQGISTYVNPVNPLDQIGPLNINKMHEAKLGNNYTPYGPVYHNPFQNILPPQFTPVNFNIADSMYGSNKNGIIS